MRRPASSAIPIDNFIAPKLKELNLTPSPEADRVTLIRRLSFDLIGLPPTPAEVDAFVNDNHPMRTKRSSTVLLASKNFGERMSVHWMDLVRFADTIGFHSDNPRAVYPYRDWLIKAFNDNKRFDEFTREQLAGDLLPNATRDQKVASGYNRLLLTTGEGGAQAKEYVKKYEADRVRNVSTVWMGATMGCCQCHDHKFDPYTTKDFYRMAAFFADIQEPAIRLPEPELMLATPEQEEQQQKLDTRIAGVAKILNTSTPEVVAEQSQWEPRRWPPSAPSPSGRRSNRQRHRRRRRSEVQRGEQGAVLAVGLSAAVDTYTIKATTSLKNITGIRLDVMPHDKLPARGPGRAGNGNFVLSEFDVTAESPAAKPAASAPGSPAPAPTTTTTRRRPRAQSRSRPRRHLTNKRASPRKAPIAAGQPSPPSTATSSDPNGAGRSSTRPGGTTTPSSKPPPTSAAAKS
jgi:hypothetical protein